MNPLKTKATFYTLFSLISAFTAQAQTIVPSSIDLFARASTDISGKTPDQVHAENLKNFETFITLDIDTNRDFDQAKFLKPSYAQEVIREAAKNPVVSTFQTSKYDPRNEGIGFCFGRAMFVHLELAHRGFDRDSIKKAFVVGPMKTPDGNRWGWHVTTIVQTKNTAGKETWLAIDPITGVKEVTIWYNEMRNNYSTDKKLKLYITSPDRFGAGSSRYEETSLKNSFYNNYFEDMDKWFDQESRTTDHYKLPVAEMTSVTR